MTHARRRRPFPVLPSGAHYFQRGLACRTNSSPRSCWPSSCLPSRLAHRPALRRLPPAAGNAEALTPDQAKRALDTLSGRQEARADDRDAARDRQRLAAAASRAPTSRNPRYRSRRTALARSSCLSVSEQVGEISREVADMARTLTHFPAFYYWFVRTANDPSAYHQLFDIAWKLALVFGLRSSPPNGWCSASSSGRWRCWKRGFRKPRVPRRRRWPMVDPPSSAADVVAEPAAASTASQPGARLAVAGQTALRARTSRA